MNANVPAQRNLHCAALLLKPYYSERKIYVTIQNPIH